VPREGGSHSAMRNAMYWVFAGLSAFLIAIEWCSKYAPLDSLTRSYLLSLHISLGLTAALVILALSVLRSLFLLVSFARNDRHRRRVLGDRFYPILFVSFIIMLISGFFEASLGPLPLQFWATPLPIEMTADESFAAFFGAVHKFVAYALAALISLYLAITLAKMTRRRKSAAPMVPALLTAPYDTIPAGPTPPRSSAIAESLAHKLRFRGQVAFWAQFVLAILSAPLLAVGASGRTMSRGAGFGEIYCGALGLLLLFIGTFFMFYFKRAAKKIASSPDHYLGNEAKPTAFWFLGACAFTGILGMLVSFIGVGLSILLLIAKTVSQPPGIAITDPTKIVRALDVLVLMVNSSLLVAHIIGVGVSVWLSIIASRARHAYLGH
jgi:cytochrome b561